MKEEEKEEVEEMNIINKIKSKLEVEEMNIINKIKR